MSLGLDGKKLYGVSQNHTISHITNQLNKAVGTSDKGEFVSTLMNFNYTNIKDETGMSGSIILKAINNSSTVRFNLGTYIGFRTDMPGDVGTEFKSEPEVDDYVAKMTMLQSGAMVFPTLADKGTWTFLQFEGDSNIKIPGLTFYDVKTKDELGNEILSHKVRNLPEIRQYIDKNGNWNHYIKPANEVLD